MSFKDFTTDRASAIVDIIAAAEGELTGRTRLQKTTYLLEIAGLGCGFSFDYNHYGPYCEELAQLAEIAPLSFDLSEEQRPSSWGSAYSVYTTSTEYSGQPDDAKHELISIAKSANPIELELAATAAFLVSEGFSDPWGETAKRKPEKVKNNRIARAQELYKLLLEVATPIPLPAI